MDLSGFTIQPVDGILLVATVLILTAFQIKGRRKMLSIKFVSDLTFALYLYLLGGFAGAMSAGIAATGGAIQIGTPPEKLKSTLKIRIITACVLSVFGVYFLAQEMSDAYPFIGVVISRFAEIFHSTLIIRIGFFISAIPWFFYNLDNEFYLAALVNILIVVSMMFGFWRNERRLPRDPVP